MCHRVNCEILWGMERIILCLLFQECACIILKIFQQVITMPYLCMSILFFMTEEIIIFYVLCCFLNRLRQTRLSRVCRQGLQPTRKRKKIKSKKGAGSKEVKVWPTKFMYCTQCSIEKLMMVSFLKENETQKYYRMRC